MSRKEVLYKDSDGWSSSYESDMKEEAMVRIMFVCILLDDLWCDFGINFVCKLNDFVGECFNMVLYLSIYY